MLEALAAAAATGGLAVAAWPGARALVAPIVVGVSVLSLTTSVAALLGEGRTSGQLSLLESFALVALVFFALRRAPRRAGAVAAVLAVVAAMVIIPSHATASDSLLENVAGMAVLALGALVAAGVARYLEALDVRRARSVAEARRDQRLSLARDLHDFVAHDVSAIVVQAQAGQVVGNRDPGQALAALKRIEQSGLHALAAMDRAVDALRDIAPADDDSGDARVQGASHGINDLEELTARFEATGPVQVELELEDGVGDELPPEVNDAVYRIVTEAFTNVRRHAPGARRVRVAVASAALGDNAAVSVTVVDDGAALPQRVATVLEAGNRSGGFGLDGLRDRVELLGGTLEAGPNGSGWQLRAVLPLSDQARPAVEA